MDDEMPRELLNQRAAELFWAKTMGFEARRWTLDEPKEPGMLREATDRDGKVRRFRVQWHRDPEEGLFVADDDPDDTAYFLVAGEAPDFTVIGWMTVAEAREQGITISNN
jgi:hypothetical protein